MTAKELKIFEKIQVFILDTLFPISCVTCGQPDIWLCEACREKIPLKQGQVCPLCEKRDTPQGRICFECRRKYSLDGLLVSFSYQQEPIKRLIQLYKYRFAQELQVPLGQLLLKSICASELPLPDCILPVPLHPRRLRWRGFNQAQLLAQYLSTNLTPGFTIPVWDNFLLRSKNTPSQMKIKNHAQRQKNMVGAFGINVNFPALSPRMRGDVPVGQRGRSPIAGKNVLLVDDVATTGATLFECAKVLKKAGAASVFGVVIARQEFKKITSKAKL